MSSINQTGLATYLDELFIEWKKNQEPKEAKWNRNLKAVKGQDITKWKEGEAETWRSRTFIKLIKVKVFVAFSMLTDVFLQGGIIPFALKHSPYEEARLREQGQENLSEDIEAMTDKIREQLEERRTDREYLKKILSLCYYGEAFSKYTLKKVSREVFRPAIVQDEETGEEMEVPEEMELTTETKKVPGHEYRSVWTIVRDPESEDLQKGRGLFEHDIASAFDLRKKIGLKGYIKEAIEEVIAENYKQDIVEYGDTLKPGLREVKYRSKHIPNKEFWGRVPRTIAEDFEADKLGKKIDSVAYDLTEDTGDDVEVLVELADKTVIRYVRRELNDMRPYKRCPWEDALDEDIGMGIADNMEDVQTSLVGMVRGFEDNKKLSGNVILGVKKRFLLPTVSDKITPGMQLEVSEACDDVRKAVQQVVIQDVGETLVSGIAMMEKWGDTVSQVPTIAQGFSLAKHKPDTLGEVQMMQENMGKYFGMIIRNMDEYFVEPEINDLYRYNMRDDEYEGARSDLLVHATGFSSFHHKIVRMQKIKEVVSEVMGDPSGTLLREVKLRPHLEEIYKSLDLDIDTFLKTEDEKQQDREQEAAALAKEQERQAAEKEGELAAKEQEEENKFQREVIRDAAKG